MVSIENITDMYNKIIDDGVILTTKEMKDLGFNATDLKELVDGEIVERVKRGHYKLKYIEQFFEYGKYLYYEGKIDSSNTLFKRCYEINNKHRSTNFQLFLSKIRNGEFDSQLLDYFDTFAKAENIFYKQDSNLYLYLLSNLMVLLEKYKEHVTDINLNMVKVLPDDKRFDDKRNVIHARGLAIHKNFKEALDVMNDISYEGYQPFADITFNELLSKVLEKRKNDEDTILNFINNKNYQELANYLINLSNIDIRYSYILKLCKDIVEIDLKGEVPEVISSDARSVNDAILKKDYERALKYQQIHNRDFGIDNFNNIIYLMLKDINKLIKGIKPVVYSEEDLNYVASKFKKLKEEGDVLILRELSDDRKEVIKEILQDYPDIKYFEIGHKKNLVLRYVDPNHEFLNLREVASNYTHAYKNDRLEECILLNKQILRNVKNVNSKTYAYMGLSYMKMHERKKAIDYLTLATLVESKKGVSWDFSQLIESLKRNDYLSRENIDTKRFVSMDVSEFGQDSYSDLDNIEEMVALILSDEMTIDSVVKEFNLNNDQKNILLLVIARDNYYQQNYYNGDFYVKMVEKDKDKSKEVKEFLNEVKTNKKYYKNRLDVKEKILFK